MSAAYLISPTLRKQSVLDVWSISGADGDTYHFLVVVKVRERLAVSKREKQKFDMEKFNVKRLTR
jgi:hypothetical protein